ncbi:MAG: choice-of-anchor Q domain-containing protein, partial [Tepidisphaeraceae bacterium]
MLFRKFPRGARSRAGVLNRAANFSVEPLEQRLVFSVFLVSNLNDSGSGSLRAAISGADAATGQNTVQFQAGLNGTISLTSGVLEITGGNVTIQGPGAVSLTIDANAHSAIFQVDAAATASISGLDITDGSATGGGAIANSGTLAVNNCVVGGSNAVVFGGGLFNGGTLTLTNSTISNNVAGAGGGLSNSGTLYVEGCTFTGNLASSDGGAISSTDGAATIVNSTFNGNSADGDGGAIFAGDECTMTVVNSTIEGNFGFTGGDFVADSSATDVTLYNTLVGVMSGPLDRNLGIEQSPSTDNIFGSGSDVTGVSNGSNGNQIGVTNLGVDSLANNGGPTETIALTSGSPANAAGSVALATDIFGHSLTTDQRGVGFPRETGGQVDIGAFQLQPTTPTTLFVDKSAHGANSGGDWADAFTSFDTALQFVANNGEGTTLNIDVAAGTYTPGGSSFNIPDFAGNFSITGGFAPGGSVTANPTQNVTTLAGGASTSNVILDAAPALTLTGFTISGGKATGGSAPNNAGGGINVTATSGALVVGNCIFNNNTAAADGGAIYVMNAGVALLVSFTAFNNNMATSSSGGAVYALSNSAMFTSCTFNGNNSNFGGAIDAQSAVTGNPSTLTLTSDTFTSNTAGDSAGAILSGFGNVIDATDCTFTSNIAPAQGAAISIFESPG